MDGTLRLWNPDTGACITTFTGHAGQVNACAWSADGRLASAGRDGTLRLWDPDTGACLATFTVHAGGINTCAWSADRRLASAGNDGTLRVWNPDTGTYLFIAALWERPDGTSGHVAWSPVENRVLSGSDDAWRFLAWQVPDAQGRLTRLPLETFGALPLDPPAYR
jgi:WD40 repeat protein